MMTVFDANLVPIIVALLVGVAIAWWIFRHRAAAETAAKRILSEPQLTPEGRPARPWVDGRDDHIGSREGAGVLDEGAAAASDIAGEMLGVRVHAELPGAEGPPDNLMLMKGVGPKLAQRLNELGISRFEQLARLSANEVTMLDDQLGPFKGRILRDRIVEQSAYLERGDRDGFEAQFGKLGS